MEKEDETEMTLKGPQTVNKCLKNMATNHNNEHKKALTNPEMTNVKSQRGRQNCPLTVAVKVMYGC